MSKRSARLSLLFGAAIVVAACAGGASPSPSAAPSTAPSTAPSVAPSVEPSGPTSDLLIGVQTDVGTINDKNFNQYAYQGAADGAKAIGAKSPPAFVPKDASEYPVGLQSYVDKGYDIIVVTGFNAIPETTKFAKANPNIWFVGVDHAPCIDAEGNPDPTFACAGTANMATLLPNYIGLNYQEDQAGYLAGIVAAKASTSGIIGAVGGITLCAPCVRYIQGFALGAKSINPDIKVKVAWVTDSDFVKAFADQAGGKTFTQQFIKQNAGIDVVFQVAGLTGNGVIDAACEAGISAVGVDVDQYLSYPDGAPCTITSATKSLALSVSESIKAIAAGTAKGGLQIWDAKLEGVGVAPFYEAKDKVGGDATQALVDKALADMKAGTLTSCPADCGAVPAPKIGD
jgi:basic membrane lipoprotein Med (substrate-binding protein (PBP1-ABC) superfamily)